MLSAGQVTIAKGNLLPGETTTFTVRVYSDVADTADVVLTLFGLGAMTIAGSTLPSDVQAAPAIVNGTTVGTELSWSWSFAQAGYATATVTVRMMPEPFAQNGYAVLQAAGGFNTMTPAFASWVVGMVVTGPNGNSVALPVLSAPQIVGAGTPGLFLTQATVPPHANVNAEVIATAGPSYQVWGGGLPYGFFSYAADIATMTTSGPVPVLVSSTGSYGPVQNTDIWTVPGPGLATVSAGMTVGDLVVFGWQNALLSLPVGIGVWPQTYAIPGPTATGGGGTGPGGIIPAGVASWFGQEWPLLAQAAMVAAADVTDQLLSKHHHRQTPVAMAFRRR